MIDALLYTALMHHRSPLAWMGYWGGWVRLRALQRYAFAWRHYPAHFRKPGLWVLFSGVPVVPKLEGRRREWESDAACLRYIATTPCWRIRLNRFLDWCCPAQRLPLFEPDAAMLGRAQ